jgi:hypothetical protein
LNIRSRRLASESNCEQIIDHQYLPEYVIKKTLVKARILEKNNRRRENQ